MKNIQKIYKNKELMKKLLFTLVIMFIFRLGSDTMLASVRLGNIASMPALDFFSMMSGGSFDSFTLFALGLSPFITSAIVIELMSNDVIPALSRIKKEGNTEKRNKIVNALGLFIAVIQAAAVTYMLDSQYGILFSNDIYSYIFTVTMLTAGSAILLWISKQIDIHGIGNGSSVIIACGILFRLPTTICQVFDNIVSYSDLTTLIPFAALMAAYIMVIMFVVYIENSERRIRIQFSSMSHIPSGKSHDYLPIKVNPSGVIPVIFASSLMQIPVFICQLAGARAVWLEWFSLGNVRGIAVYSVLIIYFTFFYSKTVVNPKEVNEKLRKTECAVVGIRPGHDTVHYLNRLLNRLCIYGAIAILIIALIPVVLPMFWDAAGMGLTVGGTSLIIVTGVTLEIAKKIRNENQRKDYRKQTLLWGKDRK